MALNWIFLGIFVKISPFGWCTWSVFDCKEINATESNASKNVTTKKQRFPNFEINL